MSLSVNGESHVPPGFRFHPTEEELLHYYLRKKVTCEKIDLDVIKEVDLNKLEPWDIQDRCKIGSSSPENEWYLFSHKDKKYPSGSRANRATAAGFWKATGRDKIIYTDFKRLGMRKTLVFYKGRAPHGQKSQWIMYEYRLDDQTVDNTTSQSNAQISGAEEKHEDGWVVCRIFRKKILVKATHSPCKFPGVNYENTKMKYSSSSGDGGLDQIVQCRTSMRCLSGIEIDIGDDSSIVQLPPLKSPPNASAATLTYGKGPVMTDQGQSFVAQGRGNGMSPGVCDWATLDQVVAFHLHGRDETLKDLANFNDVMSLISICISGSHLPLSPPTSCLPSNDDIDLWSFALKSSP